MVGGKGTPSANVLKEYPPPPSNSSRTLAQTPTTPAYSTTGCRMFSQLQHSLHAGRTRQNNNQPTERARGVSHRLGGRHGELSLHSHERGRQSTMEVFGDLEMPDDVHAARDVQS